MSADVWYCTHCAKERPEQPDYTRVDERYSIVLCRSGREHGLDGLPLTDVSPTRLALSERNAPLGHPYPGVRSRAEAGKMLREARQRRRELQAQRAVHYGPDYWTNPESRRALRKPARR